MCRLHIYTDRMTLSASSPLAIDPGSDDSVALMQAVATLLRPRARLAVATGVPFGAVEAQLKQAFVDAGRAVHAHLPPHRAVSRISIATGLNRRDVTGLTTQAASPSPAKRLLAAEVFARWASDPAYRTQRGRPRVLARLGEAPSFEALAQSVTRDVHPRSLLDELTRLGLARIDAQRDTVALQRNAYVPRGDTQRMLGFLGNNVGDHLEGAVDNVLGDGSAHFEQAVFAHELSARSLEAIREIVSAQWHAIATSLVPQIQTLVDRDQACAQPRGHRLRIGLYSFTFCTDGDVTRAPAEAEARTSTVGSPGPTNGGTR